MKEMFPQVILISWIFFLRTILGDDGGLPDLVDFRLRPSDNQDDLLDRIRRLESVLPKVTVKAIVDQANRQGKESTGGATCNPDATLRRTLTGPSYCFNPSDSSKIGGQVEWMPQGITTVADARLEQDWSGKEPILLTWYDKKSDSITNTDADRIKGVRVTFFDRQTSKYQHVLLVYPLLNDLGQITYMSVRTSQKETSDSLHAGGIVWYGNHLYVADTARGFRVFDIRYIFDLAAASNGDVNDKNLIGLHKGKYYGHGYRYILPEMTSWTNVIARNASRTCSVDAGSATFSFVGLDRSGGSDHLTSGEFCADKIAAGDRKKSGRVARWPLDRQTGEPTLTDGLWLADAAYRLPISNIQGALSIGNRWYLSRSQGSSNGFLYVTRPTNGARGMLDIESTHHAAVGPEDLSHWPQRDGSPGTLWTVTEHPGKRILYACHLNKINNRNETGKICGPV